MLQPQPDDHTKRAMKLSTLDGAAHSVMVGTGETYIPAFVLALGLGQVAAGLTATLPMLAGAVLQMFTIHWVRRARSHRRWVVLCASVQALSFIPLVMLALAHFSSWTIVLIAASTYWGAGLAAGPPWNTWMSRTVPHELRSKFFARRTGLSHVCVLVGLLLGGIVLQTMSYRGLAVTGFVVLFCAASVFRTISVLLLIAQPEPRCAAITDQWIPPTKVWHRLERPAACLLLYMVSVQTATYIAAPYFTPYMLKELAVPYSTYVVLLAAAFIAKAIALPRLGHLAHRFGARSILWIGGAGIVPTAALWTFSSSIPYLITIQVLGGIVWACYELATVLLLFERIPDDMRTSVLTTFNFANTFGIVCGSLFGGWLIRWLGTDQSAYFVIFLVTSAARLLTLPLLTRVVNVSGQTRDMVKLNGSGNPVGL